MTKLTRFLTVAAVLGGLGGGTYAAWLLRDKFTAGLAPVSPERAEYDQLVTRLGGDESAVRDELNWLIATASAPLATADRAKADALTRECLDPNTLVAIEHVRGFVGPVNRGETLAYHFVGSTHRDKLRAVAADSPSPERVLAVRKALAALGEEFGLIRQPPDWKVSIEETKGEPPPMPFLDLLRSASQFLPLGKHPALRPEPHIPAFAGPDGELLVQLEMFFNTPQARAALPPTKFPKLYVNGRIPPLPTNLDEYQKDMEEGVGREMRILLPAEDPDQEGIKAVTEVYAHLERFFTAVVRFEAK
jgi:hypothetical protein